MLTNIAKIMPDVLLYFQKGDITKFANFFEN